MDPNYSVLLGDENEEKDKCADSVNGKGSNKLIPVFIVVPIVVAAAIIALGIYFYPRYVFFFNS